MIFENKICPNCGSVMEKTMSSLDHTMVSSATDKRPGMITSDQKEVEMWECTNPLCRTIIWD